MTKKDYIKFADLFIKLRNNKKCNGIEGQVEHELLNGMIKIFESDNSRFNSDTFVDYINNSPTDLKPSLKA